MMWKFQTEKLWLYNYESKPVVYYHLLQLKFKLLLPLFSFLLCCARYQSIEPFESNWSHLF